VLDHPVDHVPDQLLVARDQALEAPRAPAPAPPAPVPSSSLMRGFGYRQRENGCSLTLGRMKKLQPRAPGRVHRLERAMAPAQPEKFHGFRILIPITLFICIVVAIKVVVDSALRRRLAETNASED
jgi:hypothetical protein